MKLNRRTFLVVGGASLYGQVEPVALGVIGSGSRGTFVMSVFQKDPSVRVGAIADVYEPNLENGLSVAKKSQADSPKPYRNYKDLLADRSIRAVLIATPEHWHHRMVLDALAAGKDVYVEKPLSHTPHQASRWVDAEKRPQQIVQVGMQRGSYDLYLEGQKIGAAGTLGNVRMVRSWWLNNYLGGGPPKKLDGVLDWEAWQGPAPRRPMDPNRFR